MKIPSSLRLLPAFIAVALAALPAARAQWQTPSYALRGGWNSIYLHGDATHATIDQLFASHPEVIEIWRWNPNPSATQFEVSSLIPTAGTPEWTKWIRGSPAATTLASLTGRSAYLVRCTGVVTDTYSVPLPQKILPPGNTWVRNGANLLGFPSRLSGNYPTMAAYFATFPAAISANTRVYKYVGGDLGASNPQQVFSPASERLDRHQAYWFEAPVVSNFYAPLELSPSDLTGLHYGRTGSLVTVRVRNRTAAPTTLTIAPSSSVAAPAGQDAIIGDVPLKLRTFDTGTGSYTEAAITSSFTRVIGPQSSVEFSFVVDRAGVTGAADALYASFLRFTDSENLLDAYLPVSARVTSLSGLWVGDIAVSGVESKAPGFTGTATARPFPLRILIHVDDAGTARLLSQVFLGKLGLAPHVLGLATRETALKPDTKATATRLVSAHLPLDTEIATGSGSVALGQTLVRTVAIPFNAPTNPFVHAYHPDHDNKDARFQPLPAGRESPTLTRALSFTFSVAPPSAANSIGWGSTVLGGTFTETITGLQKTPVTVTGTFELRRISELGTITLN